MKYLLVLFLLVGCGNIYSVKEKDICTSSKPAYECSVSDGYTYSAAICETIQECNKICEDLRNKDK